MDATGGFSRAPSPNVVPNPLKRVRAHAQSAGRACNPTGQSIGESLDRAVDKAVLKAQNVKKSAVKGVSEGFDAAWWKFGKAKAATGDALDKAGHKTRNIKESVVKGASETAKVVKG
mmetsp:Transcript_38054/g.89456  ORF Transcript_38054/g.89456 Transcript_38054/m.89456 type:complete len:117 (-) Transcript_38054:81-431(-)